jgi:hypothetical protein
LWTVQKMKRRGGGGGGGGGGGPPEPGEKATVLNLEHLADDLFFVHELDKKFWGLEHPVGKPESESGSQIFFHQA